MGIIFYSPFMEEFEMFKTSLMLGAALMISGQAMGAVIASDDFSYADGNLEGNNGGTGFSGAWFNAFGGDVNVVSGVAIKGASSGGDFRELSSAFGNTGEIWVSFDFQVPADVNTFAGLSFFTGGSEKFLIGDRFGSDVWGIAVPSGPFNNATASTFGMKTGVAKITLVDGASDTVELWVGSDAVSPVNISGPADATLGSLELEGVDRLRVGSGDVAEFDNLILATTAAEVGGVVPEPGSIALAGLAGLMVLARRRRA